MGIFDGLQSRFNRLTGRGAAVKAEDWLSTQLRSNFLAYQQQLLNEPESLRTMEGWDQLAAREPEYNNFIQDVQRVVDGEEQQGGYNLPANREVAREILQQAQAREEELMQNTLDNSPFPWQEFRNSVQRATPAKEPALNRAIDNALVPNLSTDDELVAWRNVERQFENVRNFSNIRTNEVPKFLMDRFEAEALANSRTIERATMELERNKTRITALEILETNEPWQGGLKNLDAGELSFDQSAQQIQQIDRFQDTIDAYADTHGAGVALDLRKLTDLGGKREECTTRLQETAGDKARDILETSEQWKELRDMNPKKLTFDDAVEKIASINEFEEGLADMVAAELEGQGVSDEIRALVLEQAKEQAGLDAKKQACDTRMNVTSKDKAQEILEEHEPWQELKELNIDSLSFDDAITRADQIEAAKEDIPALHDHKYVTRHLRDFTSTTLDSKRELCMDHLARTAVEEGKKDVRISDEYTELMEAYNACSHILDNPDQWARDNAKNLMDNDFALNDPLRELGTQHDKIISYAENIQKEITVLATKDPSVERDAQLLRHNTMLAEIDITLNGDPAIEGDVGIDGQMIDLAAAINKHAGQTAGGELTQTMADYLKASKRLIAIQGNAYNATRTTGNPDGDLSKLAVAQAYGQSYNSLAARLTEKTELYGDAVRALTELQERQNEAQEGRQRQATPLSPPAPAVSPEAAAAAASMRNSGVGRAEDVSEAQPTTARGERDDDSEIQMG